MTGKSSLCGSRMFGALRVYTPAVQGVVNNLTHCRGVRIYIHPVASSQVTQNPFRRDLHSQSGQLRIPARLNMINSLNALIER
jgi:hypothetical protein